MKSHYDCAHPVPIEDEPHHHLVLTNEFVRVLAVEVPAHTRTLCHRHSYDYLIYVAQGARVISAAREQEPKTLNYADGECELSKAGLVHVVDNLSGHSFRNVVVELLPASDGLLRSPGPQRTRGETKIERLLEDHRGSIVRLELKPGAEVEVAGPVVVSSPNGQELMLREVEEFDVPLNDFRRPIWVCRGRRLGIRNSGSENAAVLIFQVGTNTSAGS
jgi:hypothetical protein